MLLQIEKSLYYTGCEVNMMSNGISDSVSILSAIYRPDTYRWGCLRFCSEGFREYPCDKLYNPLGCSALPRKEGKHIEFLKRKDG